MAFLLLLSPLLFVYCLVGLLGRMFKSHLSFKALFRIVMVTKYLKLGLSQEIKAFLKACSFTSQVLDALYIFHR